MLKQLIKVLTCSALSAIFMVSTFVAINHMGTETDIKRLLAVIFVLTYIVISSTIVSLITIGNNSTNS
jgi:hypothetical protein